MLVNGQTVRIKLNPSQVKRYTELGYMVDKDQVELVIKAEHLPKSSSVVLDFSCDECGQVYQKRMVNKNKVDLCKECRTEQAKKKFNNLEKEIKIFGKTKSECYQKVVRAENQGYECCFPIQKGEGVIDKSSKLVRTYYYTIMRLVG